MNLIVLNILMSTLWLERAHCCLHRTLDTSLLRPAVRLGLYIRGLRTIGLLYLYSEPSLALLITRSTLWINSLSPCSLWKIRNSLYSSWLCDIIRKKDQWRSNSFYDLGLVIRSMLSIILSKKRFIFWYPILRLFTANIFPSSTVHCSCTVFEGGREHVGHLHLGKAAQVSKGSTRREFISREHLLQL